MSGTRQKPNPVTFVGYPLALDATCVNEATAATEADVLQRDFGRPKNIE